jgi:predicted acylesterase/phospholipase RssA
VLEEIESRMGRPASELFDMIAGTSTGGLIALGLSKPATGGKAPAYRASDLVQFYVQHGGELFPDSLARRIRSLWGLADVRYRTDPLEQLLRDMFGDTNLSEALVEVVIPSYDLSKPGPFIFKRSYTIDDIANDVKMWQVARATSAAPTYFEPARVAAFKDEGDHALVDGGVYACNPAIAAYSDAVRLWTGAAEIHVVSIGTGEPPQTEAQRGRIPVPYNRARHWGLVRWAPPMLDVVFDGVAKAVEYQMQRLCHGHATADYYRLESPLPTASHALNDASAGNISKLQADAEMLLQRRRNVLDDICAMLATVAADHDAAAVGKETT